MGASEHLTELVRKGVITQEEMDRSFSNSGASALVVHKERQYKILLDHKREQDYIEKRLDVKETTSHALGLLTYAVIGVVDQAVESVFFLAGEVANDVSFGVSRICYRSKDGWEKGRDGR